MLGIFSTPIVPFESRDTYPGNGQPVGGRIWQNLEANLISLLSRAKSGTYKASPVRRIEIAKPGSQEKRKLGTPTTEDKVLQKAVLMLLEPIYEIEFYPFSFGFRPGKSQHQALESLWKDVVDHTKGVFLVYPPNACCLRRPYRT
jgi:retron-type reverse transcriptase